MEHLSIDIETYSSIDIGKAGAYKYAESEDFRILLFAYKADDAPTVVIDLEQGEIIPQNIVDALKDESVIKHAYNAAFEWYCLNRAGYETPIEQWRCTMIHAMYCGYPAGLAATGAAIGLPEDKQKLTTGKALIKFFCNPCKPTKSNGGRTQNTYKDDLDRWALFVEYNRQDVEAEYAILQRLKKYELPPLLWKEWHHDILMNARGIRVDTALISGALYIDERSKADLTERARSLTGLSIPNSPVQLLNWVNDHIEDDVSDLTKATVEKLLKEDIPNNVREVLRIRQKLGKTSVKKYEAMETAQCGDERVKGLLQFYGANRTGRWAGRLVQVQNLPRNYIGTLDEARQLVKAGNYTGLSIIYGNVPDTLSQLIRTAFIPSKGNKFIVSDFSAIEARIIAWLAGEQWVSDVFASGGDIYCATASQMFGVPVEKHGVNGHLRQKGKIATLALGYQGGPGAMIATGALDMGIEESELQEIVDKWRAANPNIVSLWYNIEQAVQEVIYTGENRFVGPIRFDLEGDLALGQSFLTITLPSMRKLFYNSPSLGLNRFGKPSIHYMGINQTNKKWEDSETYGGKLTENIVQAIARDCLAVTLERVIAAGYQPVMHIHDEIVIDATPDQHLDDVNEIFAQPISWAPGLLLRGAGFEADYYMKD